MHKKIRIALAALLFVGITLLLLDISGTLHVWLGWMAKIQFLPAVLALNLAVIVGLLLLTLLFGRVYCSVICPRKGKKSRFTASPERKWLRYGVWVLFVAALLAGVQVFVALLAPYSAWGRIVQNLFQPLYIWGNNLLAWIAERAGSYAFYPREVWLRSLPTFLIALATLVTVTVLAWKNGRTWCNTLCPVGTTLGFFSRFALFRPVLDLDVCVRCHHCEKNCKASCIDIKNHKIDYSRCVVCGDCISKCKKDAISYTSKRYAENGINEGQEKRAANTEKVSGEGMGRRSFIATASVLAASAAVAKAQDKLTDGGFAPIVPKEVIKRETEIVPPGAVGLGHLTSHCTGCQLCVAACPNKVLRPSSDLMTLMQPRSSYESGFCRPECTKCSEVCPAGAIKKIGREEKSSIQIGHAVWDASLCLPMVDNVTCGNCGRHCPTGAIEMVAVDPDNEKGPQFPVVDESKCIGCGACEYVCPARPLSAIYVEGHQQHKLI